MATNSTTPIPSNISPVLQRALELVRADRRSHRELSAVSGVNHSVITNWRIRGGASLCTLEAVLGAMGYRLEVVPVDDVTRQRSAPNGISDKGAVHRSRQRRVGVLGSCSTKI